MIPTINDTNSNYRPQRSWGKVMFFTCVCDSVHRGVCPIACWDMPPRTRGRHPPVTRGRHLPPPPAQCMLGDTGNKWAVRILLECNLVILCFQNSTEKLCFQRQFHLWPRSLFKKDDLVANLNLERNHTLLKAHWVLFFFAICEVIDV